MAKIKVGADSVKSHGWKVARAHRYDWFILLILSLIAILLNLIEPFHRYIGPDMLTNLTYPLHKETIPTWAVPIICFLVPVSIFMVYYFFRRDVHDLHDAILGIAFSCLATVVITDSIKNAVGRPRPNFFYRCFPDGKPKFHPNTKDVVCHGIKKIIREGYKSFPSAHTSSSFAGLTFLAWYLSGKLKAFKRRESVAKLCIVFLPIFIAIFVAISRIDDYWHHWTDVFAGAIIGILVASVSYLHFFPFLSEDNGWTAHACCRMFEESSGRATTMTQSGSRGMFDNDVETGSTISLPHDCHPETSTYSEF